MTSYWCGACGVLLSVPILAKPVGEPNSSERYWALYRETINAVQLKSQEPILTDNCTMFFSGCDARARYAPNGDGLPRHGPSQRKTHRVAACICGAEPAQIVQSGESSSIKMWSLALTASACLASLTHLRAPTDQQLLAALRQARPRRSSGCAYIGGGRVWLIGLELTPQPAHDAE